MTDNTHQPSSGFTVEDHNTYVLFEHLLSGHIPADLESLLLGSGKIKPYLEAIIEAYERTPDREKAIADLRQIIAGSPNYRRIMNDAFLREGAIASGDVLLPVPSATPSANLPKVITEEGTELLLTFAEDQTTEEENVQLEGLDDEFSSNEVSLKSGSDIATCVTNADELFWFSDKSCGRITLKKMTDAF